MTDRQPPAPLNLFQEWYDRLPPTIPQGHVAQMKMAWNAAMAAKVSETVPTRDAVLDAAWHVARKASNAYVDEEGAWDSGAVTAALEAIIALKNPAPEQGAEASSPEPAREGTPASAAGNAPGAGPVSPTPKGSAEDGVEAAALYCEQVLAGNHPHLAHAYRHAAVNIRAFALFSQVIHTASGETDRVNMILDPALQSPQRNDG